MELKECVIEGLSGKGKNALAKLGVKTLAQLRESSVEGIFKKLKDNEISGFGEASVDKWIQNASDERMLDRKAHLRYLQLKGRLREAEKKGGRWKVEDLISKPDFCKWYKEESSKNKVGRQCSYCSISEKDSQQYYNCIDPIRTLYGKGKKSTRGKTLEIDREKSDVGYVDGNLVLACYYCNNAKSDVFEALEFREKIGPAIASVIKSKLKRMKGASK